MKTRTIGSLTVSVVGLGTNNIGLRMEEDEVLPVIDAALDAGINVFDTSDSYGESEVRLGRALGRRRDEVVIATKFGTPLDDTRRGGSSPDYIRSAVERSLRRLGTDRIDLYQMHWPDPDTPIEETLGALDELVVAGKVREVGCSNLSAEQLREADKAAGGTRFVSIQSHCNLLHRDDESDLIPTCEDLGVRYIPYFPLASGLLSGKYERGKEPPAGSRLEAWGALGMEETGRVSPPKHRPGFRSDPLPSDATFDVVERLKEWSEDRGHTILELAFAWLLAKPVVSHVIAGATKPHQVAANAAAWNWQLTEDEVAEVDAISAP